MSQKCAIMCPCIEGSQAWKVLGTVLDFDVLKGVWKHVFLFFFSSKLPSAVVAVMPGALMSSSELV